MMILRSFYWCHGPYIIEKKEYGTTLADREEVSHKNAPNIKKELKESRKERHRF